MDEEAVRQELHCRGCGKDKGQLGLLVCWNCFKGRSGRPPFKYYTGTLEQWFADYPLRQTTPQ